MFWIKGYQEICLRLLPSQQHVSEALLKCDFTQWYNYVYKIGIFHNHSKSFIQKPYFLFLCFRKGRETMPSIKTKHFEKSDGLGFKRVTKWISGFCPFSTLVALFVKCHDMELDFCHLCSIAKVITTVCLFSLTYETRTALLTLGCLVAE